MTTPGHPAPTPQPPTPGWQPVPGAATPAPGKRKGWLVPVLVGVLATVVLCCGGGIALVATGDSGTDTTTPAAAPDTREKSQGAPAAEASPAEKAKPDKEAPVEEKPAEEEKPKSYGVGDPVRGGDFQFTVRGVKCGIAQVGGEYLNQKAQGSYCRVDVTVKNVTKKPHMFHADNVLTAKDRKDREYKPDGVAGMYGNEDAKGFLDDINPGNSVRAYVYFDVPKGTKLTEIVFDAGLFTFAEDAVVTL